MEERMEYVGIDIAKRKFDLVWINANSSKRRTKVFDNSPVGFQQTIEWLSKNGITPSNSRLAMEATGQYHEALAEALFDAGFTVSVINPAQVKRFGEALLHRQKTDKADAELIARFCAQCDPRPWIPLPKHVRELQRLVSRLDAVKKMLVEEENRRQESAGQSLESVERVLISLKAEEKRLEKMIQDHIDRHPDLHNQQELLCSIPGVAERTSASLMAWLPANRFDDVRQAASFTGLSPKHRQSGASLNGKSKISKTGNAKLRKALYWPAITAIRCNAAAKVFAAKLYESGKKKKVVIVAVMRKIVHWAVAVIKTGVAFDAQIALAKH